LPLFEKARIEVYLPDSAKPAYPELLAALAHHLIFEQGFFKLGHDTYGRNFGQPAGAPVFAAGC
jgi:hypothetical protein